MIVVFTAVVASAQPGQVVPSEERSALLAVFGATGGEHWKDKTGWGGSTRNGVRVVRRRVHQQPRHVAQPSGERPQRAHSRSITIRQPTALSGSANFSMGSYCAMKPRSILSKLLAERRAKLI